MLNLPENHDISGYDITDLQTVQWSRKTSKSLLVTIAGNLPHFMKFRDMRRQSLKIFIPQVVPLWYKLPHF